MSGCAAPVPHRVIEQVELVGSKHCEASAHASTRPWCSARTRTLVTVAEHVGAGRRDPDLADERGDHDQIEIGERVGFLAMS